MTRWVTSKSISNAMYTTYVITNIFVILASSFLTWIHFLEQQIATLCQCKIWINQGKRQMAFFVMHYDMITIIGLVVHISGEGRGIWPFHEHKNLHFEKWLIKKNIALSKYKKFIWSPRIIRKVAMASIWIFYTVLYYLSVLHCFTLGLVG